MPEVNTDVRQARPVVSLGRLFETMKEQFLMAEREVAALNSLDAAYRAHTGEAGPDERKRGLPVFQHTCTVDGVHAVPVVSDLKLVQPEYVSHVLVPLINMHAAGALAQAMALEKSASRLRRVIEQMASANSDRQTQEAGEDNEE